VFVYGSLKKGLGNNVLMQHIDAEFLGYDTISGQFTMVSLGGFPAVCHDTSIKGTSEIYGQLYRITPDHLSTLDGLENHPRWYRREKLCTDFLDTRAWIYLMPETALANKEVVSKNMWRVQDTERAYWEKLEVRFAA